jgi:DNA-binding transcriptional MerR regulator
VGQPAEKTLAELSEESGIPARTIRFYIARGLLEGPVKSGRGAVYTAGHLARLEKIQKLQAEGRTLAEITALLGGSEPEGPPPTAWWQHAIAPDVYVMARADMSPWRTKQVRAAIQQLAALLERGSDE